MDAQTESTTWSTLYSLCTGPTPDLCVLEALLDANRFPSLTRSSYLQPLLDDELQKSKTVFNGLVYRLSHLHSLGEISSIRFCRDVERMVRGM